ncbi:hypothetical protein FNF29_00078 [Cafeteria roenbergensis]|uniref:EF-hand domain-containing protein n=1 Tax=Cafeteria roenbergensis TaxID=33653 RepID=A0A5A8CWG1_CAFRO|nr:hypothetical protein FNF29_00078 [Cafeteria roenbergensis]|eukprot:KAA0157502.1 hypothetical protein FNF29_00078 [Cafeteria roenbergensis]
MSDEIEALAAQFKHLTKQELQEYREIFNLVDKDGGGSISADELADLMETLGIHAKKEEVEAMIAEIDEDGSGEIDFPEFVAVMSRKVQADYTPSQVNAAFRVFEGSAPPGHIKQSDLIKALTTYGSTRLTDEQAKELVSQLEPDSSGLIAYAEFVSIMMGDGHEAPASGAAAAAASSAASAAASGH